MSKMPLFILTGASGTGKTTMIHELRRLMPDYVIFDNVDIKPFLRSDQARTNKPQLHNIWLRVARSIADNGRRTIICGRMLPQDIEQCEDYSYFSQVYYLILHCDDRTRELRLRARKGMTADKIQSNKSLAQWHIENANKSKPPMPIIDTSKSTVTKGAEQIKEWIQRHAK